VACDRNEPEVELMISKELDSVLIAMVARKSDTTKLRQVKILLLLLLEDSRIQLLGSRFVIEL
jgi:hypothetical protein